MKEILIAPFDFQDAPLFQSLEGELAGRLGLPVRFRPEGQPLEFSFEPRRNQYLSTAILGRVRERPPDPGGKAIGLVDKASFIPSLTFIFGEAELGGRYGIVAVARLRHEFYGGARDPGAFQVRVLKELVHELGHTFGLRHCQDARCVMFSSHHLDDTDHKAADYCPGCRDRFLAARAQFLQSDR